MGNNKQLIDFITAENELDGQETVYIAQGGKTRKTLLQKIKEFIIGTNTMGTTATDVTGAVKELNDKIGSVEKEGSVIAHLNENANDIAILNKKDLRTDKHFTDSSIFSPTLGVSHECWNKWVSVEGNNMDYAPHPNALWGEVFTGGTDTRAFQIFISVFDSARKIYVRYKHDSSWSEFRYFGTGYIKELSLKNGWEKYDLTPTYSLVGNTLTVNARIRSGVVSSDTLIAETGFYASGGQSSFFNCYTTNGQQLGTIAFTSDGRILIVSPLSSNADVNFNFSVCVN